jgi:organic hydroperoxide reductase OsmC/OhrA
VHAPSTVHHDGRRRRGAGEDTTMAREHHFAAHLIWTGGGRGGTASYDAYSRECVVEIEGKPPLVCSSAAAFRGDATKHNPEDLLVAALAACHILSYLALCARAGIEVVAYEDKASGRMAVQDGRMRFTEVMLAPDVAIASGDLEQAKALHEKAHEACFIASSVNFPVLNLPTVSQG